MFDGDEMNLHAPQSVEAATELREIAAVPLQIVSPRESTPIVSVVQDTLVGANRFTRPNVLFTKKEAMNLLVHAKRWDGVLPAPVVQEPQSMWSGQQLLSALLPPVSLQMPNSSYSDADKSNPKSQNLVKIWNGQILQGILDKSVFSKQLLHIIYNDYGPDMTIDFLDSLQAMIAAFLMNSGFSVGISDLIADEATNQEIGVALLKLTKTIEEQILQLHTGLFENSSGRSNQEEFEGKLMGTLNKAVGDAGKIGLKSLADTNRMTNMIKAGSKGSDVNVSQMVATLGQQAIEGKRVPNGFQHRTLPHFKRFDDSAQARGFIASSYIKGLQPDEFFFHAMSGREGLIDTAVKSVTGDTPIVIQEKGQTRCVPIGDWIDAQLDAAKTKVEHFEERDMELLQLEEPVYIPTADGEGNVTWGEITAITRHDPGKELYEIKTAAGKKVIVTESKSLLIYNDETKLFERMSTPDVRPGHFVPVTMQLSAPPVITTQVSMSAYLPKTEYIYGSDFMKAKDAVATAMAEREHIPAGWWAANNGTTFTLPYDSKARFQRATVRSNMENIHAGYVYPFTTNREHSRIPDTFVFNEANGRFIGLFLAEGNVDVRSGTIQITNNSPAIQTFVKNWFDGWGLAYGETTKTNHIGGTSSAIRGYSTILAQFLDRFTGHGAANKYVPAEAFSAPEPFIIGLLDGYFSGDGTVSNNSIEAGSASEKLIDGISMLCTRLGMFGRVFTTQLKSNNLNTENILPTHRISLRAQWARKFADTVPLIDEQKAAKLKMLQASASHRNFAKQNDVVLDEIIEINIVSVEDYPKVYDLTVPSTLNFGLANGLHVVDTADTGYIQRQIRVALEDLITQHDGSVRDAMGNVVQISYGEDGINATKLESQQLPLATMGDEEIRAQFAADGAPGAEEYINTVLEDRRILAEKVFLHKPQKSVRYPVHLERVISAVRTGFNLKEDTGSVEATEVLEAQKTILTRTHNNNRLWGMLVRYHLAPIRMRAMGYTPVALDALVEQIVLKHWKSWVEPGQPVGVIAAQSIGEPATQMTLNTFHLAGVAAKSNMTRGVPRLKELLKATSNPKAIELTIPLRRDLRDKKEEARRVAQELEFTLLQDIVTVARIYYDPRDNATLIAEDVDWLAYMAAFESTEQTNPVARQAADPMSSSVAEEDEAPAPAAPKSPWLLRFELDKERMFAKNITMDDIAFILKGKFNCNSMYTDYNASRLVFRVRIGAASQNSVDDLNMLKVIQNKLMAETAIRGLPGLRAVNYQKVSDIVEFKDGKYQAVDQYVLISDGSNFLEVITHPDVDPTRVVSSNIHDMYKNLGIEATRATFFKEITTLFAESGSSVNYRHICLLLDAMCHKGKAMSVDRYGINKNNIGPLAKMSFEQTEDIALRAATFGERDPILGVSAKVMLGAPIKAGTAFSELLHDEAAAMKLAASTPEQRPPAPSGPQSYTDENIEDALYGGDDTGECSTNELRLNVAMPSAPMNTVSEEMADVDIDIIE